MDKLDLRHRQSALRGAFAVAMLLAVLGPLLLASKAAAQIPVDVELVIAVDVSLSMDLDEQRIQREGYVAAFRDPEIHKAIASGAYGRIAVIYMEWAGPISQSVVVPWTVIDTPQSARALADRLEALPISRARLTSIGAALHFARDLFASSGAKSTRHVVDVSGDGPNNSGPPVAPARDKLVAEGIVINGLPIVLKTSAPSFFDLTDLDRYYAECVIGGPGSFMVPVREISELKAAIRRKLLLEISGITQDGRIIPTQGSGPPEIYDCSVGERQWRWYLDRAPN